MIVNDEEAVVWLEGKFDRRMKMMEDNYFPLQDVVIQPMFEFKTSDVHTGLLSDAAKWPIPYRDDEL